jgi:polysaccharide export outer membrane protein
MLRKILLFILSLLILSSCFQSKEIVYLKNLEVSDGDTLFKYNYTNYLLQPADILNIRIRTLDDELNKIFNKEQTGGTSLMSAGSAYLTGYSLNDSGCVTLPIIGKVYVQGLTVEQAREVIKEASVKYITSAEIEVKLMSFKVSFLGEINSPGTQNIFNNRANVFEAIALAGDINSYGKRSDILILRRTFEGTKVIKVDLTDKSILSSSKYYLQPNDIVYVQSLKSTLFRKRLTEYSGIISIFSSLITTTAVIVALFYK